MAQSKSLKREYYYAKGIGWLEIDQLDSGGIYSIKHLYQEPSKPSISKQNTQILDRFFKQKITPTFDSFAIEGTDFQRLVWSALHKIPWGETVTYGELAKQLNTSPRAIGNACRTNPIVTLIPCHRVLSKTGIGGYSGAVSGEKIDRKLALLAHEQKL